MTTQALSPWLRLLSAAERFDRGPYFIAIRRGLALSLPLIMVGALALLLAAGLVGGPTRGLFPVYLEQNLAWTPPAIATVAAHLRTLPPPAGPESVIE